MSSYEWMQNGGQLSNATLPTTPTRISPLHVTSTGGSQPGTPTGGSQPGTPTGGPPPGTPAGGPPRGTPAEGPPRGTPAGGPPRGTPAGGPPRGTPAGGPPRGTLAGGPPLGTLAGGPPFSTPAGGPPLSTPAGGPPPAPPAGGPSPATPAGGLPHSKPMEEPPPTTPPGGLPPSSTPAGGPPWSTPTCAPPPTTPTSGLRPATPTGAQTVYRPVSSSGILMASPVVSTPVSVIENGIQVENIKEPPRARLTNPSCYVLPAFSFQILPIPNNNLSSSPLPVSVSSRPPMGNDSMENTTNSSLQPTSLGMNASTTSFALGASVPIQPPKLPSSESAAFSFSGSVQLVHKDEHVKSDDSVPITGQTSSAMSSTPSSLSTVKNISTTVMATTSPPNGPISWTPPARTFDGTVALPEMPRPPGLPSTQLAPPFRTPSTAPEPSSNYLPILPTALPPNPLPYSPLSAMAPPRPGLWLNPPQPSAFPRPPFMAYPVVLPHSFLLPNHGMPFPSVTVIDPKRPTSVTIPVNDDRSTQQSDCDSASRLQGYVSPEILPPGIDEGKQPNDGDASKHGTAVTVDVWTVHKAASGVAYYYNSSTGESTYIRPAGFNGGETNKGTTKTAPVSWEKVMGMDWVSVSTNDGREYYHNSKTKLSCWEMPPEVADIRKKQDVLTSKALNDDPTAQSTPKAAADKGIQINSTSAGNNNLTDPSAVRPTGGVVISTALDLIKRKLQDAGAPASSISPVSAPVEINGSRVGEVTTKEDGRDRHKGVSRDANVSDVSSDSEVDDAGRTKEELIVQFKEMLKDRGVAPFSKWDKELPKIVFDPRFKAVPGYSARRSLFEHFVKTRAEEMRKEKRAAQRASTEEFKELLESASKDIDPSTDYQSFKKKWGNDSRFFAVERKEREHLLNERILPLRKAAEEKAQNIRVVATSSFKSLLQEKGDITLNSRWSRVKENIRGDTRYKSVGREDREALFDEYVNECKVASEEAERSMKARKEEEERRKERERELRKRKERDEQEMERVRLKVRRKDAIVAYQALLVEKIKDPLSSWTESKPKLEKDPQGRATSAELEPSDIEKLFREHVKALNERCAEEYKALLYEVVTEEAGKAAGSEDGKTPLSSWVAAKELLRSDPRYAKMPRKGREHLWLRYVEDIQRKVKRREEDDRDKADTAGPHPSETARSATMSGRDRDPRWLLIRPA